MQPRFLLDTDICIYIRQKRPSALLSRFRKLKPGSTAISVITYGELRFGAEKSARRTDALLALEELTSLLPVLTLPADAARVYGAIRAELAGRGEIIGNNDLWIAAHAKSAALTLITNNEREFKRIAGLKVQNWARR
jgi:tRNA(fMet)-specific endonuclease VapC